MVCRDTHGLTVPLSKGTWSSSRCCKLCFEVYSKFDHHTETRSAFYNPHEQKSSLKHSTLGKNRKSIACAPSAWYTVIWCSPLKKLSVLVGFSWCFVPVNAEQNTDGIEAPVTYSRVVSRIIQGRGFGRLFVGSTHKLRCLCCRIF